MITYAITGGMGMGKSATVQWLRSHGIAVVDADDLAREVVEPGTQGLERLCEHFGKQILNDDGSLNRAAVADIVFRDPDERKFLESVLHPLIRQGWKEWCARCEADGKSVCAVAIPLLYEVGGEGDFDAVICLVTSPKVQVQRLLKRGLTAEEITRRNAAQWPLEEKTKRAQYVLDNNGTLADLGEKLAAIFSEK